MDEFLEASKGWNEVLTVALSLLATIGAGTIVAALIASLSSRRDLAMRRRVETHKVFFQASALAHGRGEGGATVEVGEQIAAMYVVADLAVRDKWLREPGINQLKEQITWFSALRENRATDMIPDITKGPEDELPHEKWARRKRDAEEIHEYRQHHNAIRLMMAATDALQIARGYGTWWGRLKSKLKGKNNSKFSRVKMVYPD